MTPTSPGPHARLSSPRRNSIFPLSTQKTCSWGCLWAAAWAPAFMDHQTTISLSPTSSRRVILSVIFSSGRCRSAWKPFMLAIVCLPVSLPRDRGLNVIAGAAGCQVTRRSMLRLHENVTRILDPLEYREQQSYDHPRVSVTVPCASHRERHRERLPTRAGDRMTAARDIQEGPVSS